MGLIDDNPGIQLDGGVIDDSFTPCLNIILHYTA
jgi:hypothetical protein